ncbi:MAG: repair protein RadC [Acidobacteria bacterium]|jgi:DNA repair protein RadC|nr:repair protein RadC [Acidobacteriota bacterium]
MGSRSSGKSRSATGHTSIKDWPADERPRERLLRLGPQALSDAELVAILIRAGTRDKTALDLARSILAEVKTLRGLATRNARELTRLKGIGNAKAVEVLAALEIGRRIEASEDSTQCIIHNPSDVAHRMIPLLRDRPTEVFYLLALDAKNGLTTELEISRGTLNASLVHPREVYKAAIDNIAASIIVVHNHPSGNPEPSREDIDVTRQLAETGKIVGIPLHDHIIVAGSRYTSLAEKGFI